VISKLAEEKIPRTVALVTLGCARNETDSEELAGRLAADGWLLVNDPTKAEIAVINTCGFIESAKKDSIDALIQAHSLKGNGVTKAVVAVGCMAERYGERYLENVWIMPQLPLLRLPVVVIEDVLFALFLISEAHLSLELRQK